MSPQGRAWPADGASVTDNDLVANFVELVIAASLAALIDHRFMANGLWTTDETVRRLATPA